MHPMPTLSLLAFCFYMLRTPQERSCAEDGLHSRVANASLHAETWDLCASADPPVGARQRAAVRTGGAPLSLSKDDGDNHDEASDDDADNDEDDDDGALVVEAYLHQGMGNQLF